MINAIVACNHCVREMIEAELHELTLEFLIQATREEAQLGRSAESGYCYELFRRAFDQGQENAWMAIQRQYQRLLLTWLSQASKRTLSDDELRELAQVSFMKFWRTLSQHPYPIADHFEHSGAILKYLKQCAITAWIDHQRCQQRYRRLHARLQHMRETAVFNEIRADKQVDADGRLRMVKEWVEAEVNDPLETLLLKLLYENGLKPRQIVKMYPDKFPTTRDVYRVKERVLKRAKRALAKRIQDHVSENGADGR